MPVAQCAAVLLLSLSVILSNAAGFPSRPGGLVFEVRDFGAAGDGIHDDSAAIARAVAAASAAGGGVVHFACGDWRADTVLNGAPAQRTALYFSGLANITFRGEGRCSRVFTTVAARTVFEIQKSKNVSFAGLRIEPAAALFVEHYQNDGGSAIRLAGVEGGSIRDVEMSGGAAALVWLNAGTRSYTVAHNFIHDAFGNAGIWEDDCSAGDSSVDCGASLPPYGNAIEDNLFVENGMTGGVAQVVLDSGGHVTNTRVTGNTIRGRAEPRNPHIHGIQVGNASGAVIAGNRIVDVLDDGIAVTAADGITITGTEITGNTIEGGCGDAAIIVYAAVQGRVSGTVVQGNHLRALAGRGIAVAGTFAANVTGTEIVDDEIGFGGAGAGPVDALALRGKGVRVVNVRVTADAGQAVWVRVDPDASEVRGVGSVQRVGAGTISVFDPAGRSDAGSARER